MRKSQKPQGARSAKPVGIVRTATGWRTWVRLYHGKGGLRSHVWKPDASMQRMKAWREEQRVRYRLGAVLPPSTGTGLRQDVRDYLAQRQTMPTLADRTRDLEAWIAVFGPERDTDSIQPREIRTQLETWRTEGYAANTCNHRRTALAHLYTVKNGKGGKNPVKDVPKYRDESQDCPPRALSAAAVALLLHTMTPSLSRAALVLMAWTGWPQTQITKLTPADVRWNVAVRLQPRRKGKGATGVWLPLLPQGWAALEAFKKAGAWGTYHKGSARRAFRLAAAKVRARVMLPLSVFHELEDVTPYQLRHSFLTMIAAVSRDDRAVQTLGQHSNLATSHRYTTATADPRALAALQMVTTWLHPAPDSPQPTDSKHG